MLYFIVIVVVVVVVVVILIVVIVIVDNCSDGAIRLIGGDTQYEGAVEVCVNRIWSAVCPAGWDVKEATVVCRQLGYITTGMAAILQL